MKKIVAVILLTLPVCLASAQVSYNDSREDILANIQWRKKSRAHIRSNNITSMQLFAYKGTNPVGSLTNEWTFDKRGNTTDYFMHKHGKIKMHNIFTYDDSDRTTSNASYSESGKLNWMSKITYDKAGNVIEEDYYKKDPQAIKTKTIKTYDSRNNITESKEFDGKGKLKDRVEYTYYDDGSKKQTIEYSGKGKVLQLWNFDCNPVGKLQAAKFKDTNKICVRFETDKDGNPIKVKEEYLGGEGLFGKTYRNVTKYDKNNDMLDDAWYKLNGKLISHWSESYNAAGKMTESIIYKGGTQEIFYKNTYTYDNNDNIAESVFYKKSKLNAIWKYVYASALASPGK